MGWYEARKARVEWNDEARRVAARKRKSGAGMIYGEPDIRRASDARSGEYGRSPNGGYRTVSESRDGSAVSYRFRDHNRLRKSRVNDLRSELYVRDEKELLDGMGVQVRRVRRNDRSGNRGRDLRAAKRRAAFNR